MSTAQKSGVIVYSKQFRELSQFYIAMFDMDLLRETKEFVSIGNDQLNIVVHAPPFEVSAHTLNTVKIFLTVECLNKARGKAEKLGGQTLKGEWSNPLFKVCNIVDPDGNQIQLREFIS
ncbi:hypothetical protein [Microbulbifer spongiae]|uniref:VOC domain-containing protein n=1 Tax=Microbulbifer spongiae TaxID=2944933 RepID=A0ABY9EFA5_9GAMM|nr:hypothetical protein [Microbulbifer sp. MI-G]WKD50045.1 hypothetical protein M8T91_01050 [Microbulbifer sp. MI-G]